MKKSTKYIVTTAAAAAMMLGSFSVSYAATGWVTGTVDKETVWYWYDSNGQMVKHDWVQSPTSGLWYYFDDDGIMLHDCWGDDAKSEGYYFGSSGDMATGWRQVKLDEEQSYGPGSETDEKGYFYFGSDGMVKEGWINLNGTYYFLNDGYVDGFADYQMVYGEVEIDGEEYYFGEANDGSMKKGMVKVITESNSNSPSSTSKETYYLYRDNGTRAIGDWCKYNNEWYYVNDNGEIVTENFVGFDSTGDAVDDMENADTIYYMDKNGIMKKGWLELGTDKEIRPGVVKGKTYYYFKDSGRMVTGWVKDGGKYYYMNPSATNDWAKGQMVTGLVDIDGDIYYFATNGAMAASSWQKIEESGNDYYIYLEDDGRMIKAKDDAHLAYKKVGTKQYFIDKDGCRIEEKGAIIAYRGNGYTIVDENTLVKGEEYWEIASSGVAKRATKR